MTIGYLLKIIIHHFSQLFISAVRYGRVPKRSREIGSSDDMQIRVNTPSTPTAPQICSVSSTPEITTVVVQPEPAIDSPTSNLVVSPELNVYDVILCISQAHRTHCSYTDEQVRGLNRRPIPLPSSSGIKEENGVSHLIFNILLK